MIILPLLLPAPDILLNFFRKCLGGLTGGEGGCRLIGVADSAEYCRDSNEALRGDTPVCVLKSVEKLIARNIIVNHFFYLANADTKYGEIFT